MPSAESKAADGSTLRKRAQEKHPKDSPVKRTRRASATRTSNKKQDDTLIDKPPVVTVETPPISPKPKKFEEPSYVNSELDKVAKHFSDDKKSKRTGDRSTVRSRGKKNRRPLVTASSSRYSSPTPRATAFYRPVPLRRAFGGTRGPMLYS